MIKINARKKTSVYIGLLGFILTTHATLSVAETAADRLADCANDPRVLTGQLSAEICAGADIFFRETFDGNGRTCGTCHRAEDNFTISPAFIASLPDDDALFIAENDPALATLERPQLLRDFALILANVDGLDDLDNKFTLRSTPHTLSMSTSLSVSAFDGSTTPPLQRTGWSGDGAPNDGTLRDFLTGAVTQHFPTDLSRTPGESFRLPDDDELDLALAYQMSLGRTNELDLSTLELSDEQAQAGIAVFIGAGQCNACHVNAGANFIVDNANANFNTGVENIRIPAVDAAGIPLDGGFGGQGLSEFNFDTDGDGVNDAFGNGSFNSTPLVEAADTGPFFHTNAFDTLEGSIAFYNTDEFAASPGAQFIAPVNMTTEEVNQVGRLLRVLNVAFNIDMALQRLNAADQIDNELNPRDYFSEKRDLLELALFELEDALEVLEEAPEALHENSQTLLTGAIRLIERTLDRRFDRFTFSTVGPVSQATVFASLARNNLGSGIDYTLGEGNLMR